MVAQQDLHLNLKKIDCEIFPLGSNSFASIDFARKRDLKIIDKPLEEIKFDEKSSMFISLFDVLEHLSNPREILDKVHDSLFDRNGFIYVPNWNSATK